MTDLPAYLSRVGLTDEPDPDLPSLEALHVAHLSAIPFENIDVRLGKPIRLDLAHLEAKLVQGERGGYCFEQNTLFAAVLRTLGYQVDTLEARVRPREATAPLPRTHMTLRVRVGDADVLADVGFGAYGPLLPVPLDGTVSEQPDGEYRVEEEGRGIYVLQLLADGRWRDQYAFGLEPALPVDFAVANHFTSTFPTSPFLNTLTVQRSTGSGRHILRGRTYATRNGDQVTERMIVPEELPGLLREPFGLEIPEADALRALGDG